MAKGTKMSEQRTNAKAWLEGAIAGFKASNDCGVNGSTISDTEEIKECLPENPYEQGADEKDRGNTSIDIDAIIEATCDTTLKQHRVVIYRCSICGIISCSTNPYLDENRRRYVCGKCIHQSIHEEWKHRRQ